MQKSSPSRTSRPLGGGRRCAPRRQLRPPSGDQHPGDGAMASRPSRRSITCPWRLSGSSGLRPRIWAPGGLGRQVYQIQISGKSAHAPAPRDTWRGEDPGKRRTALKAAVKPKGRLRVFRVTAVGQAGGGRPQSVTTSYPMVTGSSVISAGPAHDWAARATASTWQKPHSFGQEPKDGCRWLLDVLPRWSGIRAVAHPRHARSRSL